MRRVRASRTEFDELPNGMWRRRLVAGDPAPIPAPQTWGSIVVEYGNPVDVNTRSGGQPTHDCPGNCGRQVAHRRYACATCWPRLPRELQLAITTNHGRDLGGHGDAMRVARRWFVEHPLSAATRRAVLDA